MHKHSKRYEEVEKKIPFKKKYELNEAIIFLRENNKEKIKRIKVSFSLNIKEKNDLSCEFFLPHNFMKKKKIALINDNLPEVIREKYFKENDIFLMSINELKKEVEKRRTKWNFEKIIAHLNDEENLTTLGKKLGSKGLYPNRKNKNLTGDIDKRIKEIRDGILELKINKKVPSVQVIIGDISLTLEEIIENYKKTYHTILSMNPKKSKIHF